MLKMTADKPGKCESGRVLSIGEEVEYLGHVVGGMVRIRFSDGTKDVAHPHCFRCLR